MIALLFQRNFALLWAGGFISLAGDWVLGVGLPIYVFLLTHSVLATSVMVLAGHAPSIFLGMVAGVFVDRWDRKRTMVVTNLLLALLLLPLLLVRSADRIWIVYLVGAMESAIQQFCSPAESALLPTLVGADQLVAANALNSLSSTLARLLGPALGGVVAGVWGLTGVVLADAASFALAGLLIARIIVYPARSRTMGNVPPAADPRILARIWDEWIEGLHVISSDRTLTVLMGAVSIVALGEGVMAALYAVFVNRILHGGAPQIGELMSAQAIGGLIGGVLVGWIGNRILSRWTIGLCSIAFGLIDLVIFNSPTFFPAFWLSVGLFVAVGIPGIGFLTGIQSLTQSTAPDGYRGRIFGTVGTTMGLLGLIGTIAAGTVTDHLGVVTVLNIQGAGYILAGMLIVAQLPRAAPAEEPIEHFRQDSIGRDDRAAG
jgi:MFS family permease